MEHVLMRMIAPTSLGLFFPIIIGTLFGIWVLVAYLIGLKIYSALLAVFKFNAGGQLDNAKSLIETLGRRERNNIRHPLLVILSEIC